MKLTDSDIKLVNRFDDLDLNETELLTFESRLNEERTFKKEVESYLAVRSGIINVIASNANEDPPNLNKLSPKRTWLNKTWKLILAVILICTTLLIIKNTAPDPSIILAECEQYTLAISGETFRSNEEQSSSSNQLASTNDEIQKLYRTNQYSKALSLAETELVKLSKTTERETLEWWITTLALKLNKKELVKSQLASISDNPNYNSNKKANKLLSIINN